MNITPQINYNQAIKRWCQRVDEYNETCATVQVKRTVALPTGEKVVQTSTRKTGTIKANVKATGMHLIKQYANAWASANMAMNVNGIADPKSVYLSTNRVEMGERLNRSRRSVYDHLTKLREVGLVDNYEFCGRQHDFKLWISPNILFGEDEAAPTKTPQKPQKSSLSQSVRQNLPPNYTSQKQYSTTIRAVECGQTLKHNHGNNEDPHSPGPKGKTATLGALCVTETRTGGRAAAEYDELFTRFNRLPKALKEMVFNLWLLIRTTLYGRIEWTNDENTAACLEIYDHLFGRFAVQQSEKAWVDYCGELKDRVEMAKAWFDKNPKRHPDLPYQRGKKMGYFDPKNNFGFAITGQWLAKDTLRKRENRVEYLLNQARIDFERLAQGKPRPSKIDKDELQLFVYYQNQARSYGKDVEDKFCTQYLAQKARGFAPAKPPKLTIRAQKAADKAAEIVYVEPWMEMGESFVRY